MFSLELFLPIPILAFEILTRLIGQVHARVNDVAVGKLSLNLMGLSKESVSVFGTRLSQAFKNLLPFTHYIPLTLEYLNTASLAPKKDYQANRYPCSYSCNWYQYESN